MNLILIANGILSLCLHYKFYCCSTSSTAILQLQMLQQKNETLCRRCVNGIWKFRCEQRISNELNEQHQASHDTSTNSASDRQCQDPGQEDRQEQFPVNIRPRPSPTNEDD